MIINYFHSISSLQEPVRRRSIILATGLNHFQRLARSSLRDGEGGTGGRCEGEGGDEGGGGDEAEGGGGGGEGG